MAATKEEVLAGLAEIVNEIAGIPTEDVQLDKSFTDDLDVDSLQQGGIKAGEVRAGYRATIGDDEVSEFADIVSMPLDQRSYVCRALIEPDSRALRSLSKVIAGIARDRA